MPRADRDALNTLIVEIFRLNGAIIAAGDALTKPFGLSSARWQVMGAIAVGGGGTVSELARKVGVARQSLQRVVTEMANEQLVELVDNPRHKRARRVMLTAKGRCSYDAIDQAWMPIADHLGERFGADALLGLVRSLAELRGEVRALASPTAGKADASVSTFTVSARIDP